MKNRKLRVNLHDQEGLLFLLHVFPMKHANIQELLLYVFGNSKVSMYVHVCVRACVCVQHGLIYLEQSLSHLFVKIQMSS